jgi:hypothetical protein
MYTQRQAHWVEGLTKVVLLESREDKLQEALGTINHLEGAVRLGVIRLVIRLAVRLGVITLGHLGEGEERVG